MELKLHPDMKGPLTMLCSDPNTTVVVLSGSDRNVLDEVRHLLFFCDVYWILDFEKTYKNTLQKEICIKH